MKRLHAFRKDLGRKPQQTATLGRVVRRRPLRPGALVVLALALAVASPASAQVVPTADAGGTNISAGVMGSGFYLQYGERKMLGIAAFVDADTRRRIGFEAEGRWLRFHLTADPGDVNTATYLIGGRYHYDIGRFQLYGKGLVGFGQINLPYGYGHDNCLVIAPGGGVDYLLTRRMSWRVDAEYQSWPQFNYGTKANTPMTSLGVSTGIRVHIF